MLGADAVTSKNSLTSKRAGCDSDNRMISNIFDRAARGLLKAPESVTSPASTLKRHGSKQDDNVSPREGICPYNRLDLSKITPALKNVKQVSPPAPLKIDLTEPGELPLDLSTKKREAERGG